jgi:Ser/Thr protein kinase RdoA (MazF antagonist)
LRWLGRFIGRLHAVGERRAFVHRRALTPAVFGHQPLARVLALDLVPPAQLPGWRSACEQALAMVDRAFAAAQPAVLRLHGDCHPGNILWRDPDDGRPDAGPHIVDLDDAVTGPAIQDLWMLLSGSPDAMRGQMAAVLGGYRAFRRFDTRELLLIEPLRTLRMIHHSAWLAERWSDPAFPVAFPWFGSPSYWQQQTTELREQIERMQDL